MKLCNYTGNLIPKGRRKRGWAEKELPSLLSRGLVGFFLAIDDNLHESPFRTFITGDFIA